MTPTEIRQQENEMNLKQLCEKAHWKYEFHEPTQMHCIDTGIEFRQTKDPGLVEKWVRAELASDNVSWAEMTGANL